MSLVPALIPPICFNAWSHFADAETDDGRFHVFQWRQPDGSCAHRLMPQGRVSCSKFPHEWEWGNLTDQLIARHAILTLIDEPPASRHAS